MIRIGVGSWTLPWAVGFPKNPFSYKRMSPIELVDYAKIKHIDLVQLYNNIDLLSFTTSDLSQLKRAADSENIALEIGGVGIQPGYLHNMLKIAQAVESKSLRTIISPVNDKNKRCSLVEIIDTLNQSIGEFEEKDIQLLLENHDRYTSIEYRKILESIGSNALGICFDSANSLGNTEHFRDSFMVLKDYIRSAHFKEYSIERVATKMGFIIQGCKPGEGENIAEEFIGLLTSQNRDIHIVLEQWVPYQGTIEDTLQVEKSWADEGIRIIKSLIK